MFDLISVLDFDCSAIPEELTSIVRTVVTVIQVAVPIILIIFGMLDMGKAVASQKEDEIKKAQGMFVKRCIYAVVVFLVVAIVRLILGMVGGASEALACVEALFG